MPTRPSSMSRRRIRSSSSCAIWSTSKNWAARCDWARGPAIWLPGSLAQRSLRRREEISERHRHRYEFNPEFRETLEKAGLVFSGISPDGKFVEMVELPRDVHPWFLGCQFHPEYKSKPLDAHPLFASFVRAAYENRLQNETSMDKNGETEAADS